MGGKVYHSGLRGKRATTMCYRGGSMQSSRRHLLLMSFAVAPAVLLHLQDTQGQADSRGRRRPDGSEDPSNGPNPPGLPAASSKALLEERQKNIKKEVEKLYDLAAQLK